MREKRTPAESSNTEKTEKEQLEALLLGYIHQLLPRRPDLKLIVTSATIDTQRFSEHFHDALLGL